jgi:hypothetical protein
VSYSVTLTALVGGNPLKAWRDGSEPDDVWEDQRHEFGDDLEAAKAFIRGLHPDASTHVVLLADETPIYVQDFGEDDLDTAGPDVVAPSQLPAVPPDVEDVTPEAPPAMPAQNPGV